MTVWFNWILKCLTHVQSPDHLTNSCISVLDTSFLERLNTLLANGEVPGLFEGDEYTTLMTQIKEGAARQGHMLDSQDELYKWFTLQVIDFLGDWFFEWLIFEWLIFEIFLVTDSWVIDLLSDWYLSDWLWLFAGDQQPARRIHNEPVHWWSARSCLHLTGSVQSLRAQLVGQ